VDATIHWVSAAHAIPATVRLYDRLFRVADPLAEGADITENLDPKSLEILRSCQVEPSLTDAIPGSRVQFERVGYFCVDSVDSSDNALVFNRTVTLRDSWAKITEKGK
jgi:glutaminyl-tRNA synthetase